MNSAVINDRIDKLVSFIQTLTTHSDKQSKCIAELLDRVESTTKDLSLLRDRITSTGYDIDDIWDCLREIKKTTVTAPVELDFTNVKRFEFNDIGSPIESNTTFVLREISNGQWRMCIDQRGKRYSETGTWTDILKKLNENVSMIQGILIKAHRDRGSPHHNQMLWLLEESVKVGARCANVLLEEFRKPHKS